MKQQELLAAIGIGIFVAIIGLVITNSFIADPNERKETVQQVRPFGGEFNIDATSYLNDNETTVYQVDINVEESVGDGNSQPFNSN